MKEKNHSTSAPIVPADPVESEIKQMLAEGGLVEREESGQRKMISAVEYVEILEARISEMRRHFSSEIGKLSSRAHGWRLAFFCLLIFGILLWVYSHPFSNPGADIYNGVE